MSPALLRTFLLSVILLGTSPATLRAEESGDARDWLVRMEQAVESLSYEGTFVHMVGNSIETMHVIHRAVDGEVAERLFSRDQPGREILRHNDKVTCIFADQRTVLVDRRKDRNTPLLGALPQDSDETQPWYQIVEVGEGHKLGRSVKVIEIRPQDSYRYGHRLWLDEQTAMPLKIQLLAPQGVVLEQIQFVSMTLPAEISDARLQADVEVDGFTWYEQGQNPAPDMSGGQVVAWTIDEPPPGFRLTEARTSVLPGAEYPVEHLVYSDGMASVSVFIEPAEANEQELAGLSRMGAAHAFTLMIGDRQITAVGEVPPVTVERLARSLRQLEAPAN